MLNLKLQYFGHFLLQGIFTAQQLNSHLLHCQLDSLLLGHLDSLMSFLVLGQKVFLIAEFPDPRTVPGKLTFKVFIK